MNNETMEIKINEHDKKIDEHEDKINSLEKSDTKQDSKIDNLCEKIDGLIIMNNKWLYFAITSMIALLAKILFF
ncbi:hemolysin XhlA family protein [Clostridium scatologenes]|uniref:Uncharacterized protein n=1 Tax=Clostridium scatologenes TaxID=1548 RepID=A0A0E3K4G6_CLOSL|nr:hemolysin XhlA family protein [Clostridium scatologenes]AKA71974.1 hypothetical protein CSCA_4849 [Clostridium scatologenes]